MNDHIAPALRDLALPVTSLTPHPRNARQGDIGAIVESLRRFGQQKPIVAQRHGAKGPHVVVAGNHLLASAKELGWTHVAVNVVDMSDRDALAFLVADNRTQELGTYDQDQLAAILKDLAMDDLTGTGFDGDDVDDLLEKLSGDTNVKEYEVKSVYQVIVTCPDETKQLEALEALEAQGYDVKALTV